MALFFPAIILSKKEANTVSQSNLTFDRNGYLIDPELHIQKTLENHFGQPIMVIQETTQKSINLLTEPYGLIQINPSTHKRMAILNGDADYITSTLKLMIQMHPTVDPSVIIDNYSFQCSPQDRLKIREWTKTNYNCI